MQSKYILKIILTFCLFEFPPSQTKLNENRLENISTYIHHAETFYWLGMEEEGNVSTFDRGLSYLDKSDSLILGLNQNSKIVKDFKEESRALRLDLDNQILRTHDRFYGKFPVINLMNYNIFSGENSPGRYELVDNPKVSSAIQAVQNLANEIVGKWGR